MDDQVIHMDGREIEAIDRLIDSLGTLEALVMVRSGIDLRDEDVGRVVGAIQGALVALDPPARHFQILAACTLIMRHAFNVLKGPGNVLAMMERKP